MSATTNRPDPGPRAIAESQIHWWRGLLILAAMVGVFLTFFIVLSLLQGVGRQAASIQGLAPVPTAAAARTAATAAPAAAAPIAPASVATPTAAAPASPTGVTAVARGAPFVRGGPGINYPILTNLQDGESVSVIGRTPDSSWIQIMLANGTRGWSSAGLLGVSGNLGSVPVTQ